MLALNGLAGAEVGRGKFRSYLLGALKHFISKRRLRASREKRGGQIEHQSLEVASDTNFEMQVAAESPRMESLFDREWALAMVERALALLEREAESAGTHEQFAVLKSWLSFDEPPGSQASAAARLGVNEGAVKVAVHRLRRRFRELVRAEVEQTVPTGEDLEIELHHLIEVLASQQSSIG